MTSILRYQSFVNTFFELFLNFFETPQNHPHILLGVMVLFKAMLRFLALLMLSCMIVYAPEILSAVSAPYAAAAPTRMLLRIALCCDEQSADAIYPLLNAYQKKYPSVHLRITQRSAQQLTSMQPPYPDVILCRDPSSIAPPPVFSLSEPIVFPAAAQTSIYVISQHNAANSAGAHFTAYINEAVAASRPASQN